MVQASLLQALAADKGDEQAGPQACALAVQLAEGVLQQQVAPDGGLQAYMQGQGWAGGWVADWR